MILCACRPTTRDNLGCLKRKPHRACRRPSSSVSSKAANRRKAQRSIEPYLIRASSIARLRCMLMLHKTEGQEDAKVAQVTTENHNTTELQHIPSAVSSKPLINAANNAEPTKAQKTKTDSYNWLNGWRKSRNPTDEQRKKRSVDATDEAVYRSKRRQTVTEETILEQMEQENWQHRPRHRSVLLPSRVHKLLAQRETDSRPALFDVRNRKSQKNTSSRHLLAQSGESSQDTRKSESLRPVEPVIGLDRLTLSDDHQEDFSDELRLAKTTTATDIEDSTDVSHSVNIIENTRLMGMIFHYPVAAMLESQTCTHKLTRVDTTRSVSDQVETPIGPEVTGPRSYVLWLPQTPVDETRLDEFHMYHERIFRYLYARDLEATSYYKPDFLKKNGLSEVIRSTLCDWMIKVQQYLKLRTETLHLAVSLVDRYTWLRDDMNPSDYQLAGITALFVAAKFVERFAPTTATLCYLTENSYRPKQVLEFEMHLLQTLDFDMVIPLPHHFLTRAMLACTDMTKSELAKVELICCYLFELSLTEMSAVGVTASLRCAAAVRLVRQLLRAERARVTSSPNTSIFDPDSASDWELPAWTDLMVKTLGHDDNAQLRTVALIYLRVLRQFQSGTLCAKDRFEAAFHKFSNRGYRAVAQCDTLQLCDYDAVEASLCNIDLSDPHTSVQL